MEGALGEVTRQGGVGVSWDSSGQAGGMEGSTSSGDPSLSVARGWWEIAWIRHGGSKPRECC